MNLAMKKRMSRKDYNSVLVMGRSSAGPMIHSASTLVSMQRLLLMPGHRWWQSKLRLIASYVRIPCICGQAESESVLEKWARHSEEPGVYDI